MILSKGWYKCLSSFYICNFILKYVLHVDHLLVNVVNYGNIEVTNCTRSGHDLIKLID